MKGELIVYSMYLFTYLIIYIFTYSKNHRKSQRMHVIIRKKTVINRKK